MSTYKCSFRLSRLRTALIIALLPVAKILRIVHGMTIRRTITTILSSCVLLCPVMGARPSLGLPPPSLSDPPQTSGDCEEWEQRPQDADPADNSCESRRAFRAE